MPHHDTEITPSLVRESLDYDPATGVLRWKERARHRFSSEPQWRRWNTRYAGKIAGGVRTDRQGYRYCAVRFMGRLRKAHHLCWLHMTDDPLPPLMDHRDRDATNNAWANLRACNQADNSLNKSMQSNNTSGVTGVSWNKREKKWHARIKVGDKNRHLGQFRSLQDAIEARRAAEVEHGFSPGHGLPRTYSECLT